MVVVVVVVVVTKSHRRAELLFTRQKQVEPDTETLIGSHGRLAWKLYDGDDH